MCFVHWWSHKCAQTFSYTGWVSLIHNFEPAFGIEHTLHISDTVFVHTGTSVFSPWHINKKLLFEHTTMSKVDLRFLNPFWKRLKVSSYYKLLCTRAKNVSNFHNPLNHTHMWMTQAFKIASCWNTMSGVNCGSVGPKQPCFSQNKVLAGSEKHMCTQLCSNLGSLREGEGWEDLWLRTEGSLCGYKCKNRLRC